VQTHHRGARAVALVVALALIAVGAGWYVRRGNHDEDSSVVNSAGSSVSANTNVAKSDIRSSQRSAEPQSDSIGTDPEQRNRAEYPVKLDALRARFPDNRYWALGAPTSDPVVAKARATRAERDNQALGRIQANEASPDEIHAYYTERRAISRDYLQIAETVLAEQGTELPERDRGMFELTVNLHKARLQQIDRDERDALGRIASRTGSAAAPPP
jgi:hypothetical protein